MLYHGCLIVDLIWTDCLHLVYVVCSIVDPQQNYVDYHKCVNAKGEEFAPCQQFKRAYRSLCPSKSTTRSCDTYHLT